MLDFEAITKASQRLKDRVHRTPVLSSTLLNQSLGHQVYFKCENFQKVGAFKARGALNALSVLEEKGELPPEVFTYSSGNHAQAIAWACSIFGVKATVFMDRSVSPLKRRATQAYGAEVVECEDRRTAEKLASERREKGGILIPPFDHDDVIAGQGTACLEALKELTKRKIRPDAIFAPCGGGGLLSGTYLAARGIPVFGAEPKQANDAFQSFEKGKIVTLPTSPDTVADGVRTLSVSERTFEYLQKLAGIYEVSEEKIIAWTQWLTHLLKTTVEPTSALGIAAAAEWLREQKRENCILVVLSGGNLSIETRRRVWERDYLEAGIKAVL